MAIEPLATGADAVDDAQGRGQQEHDVVREPRGERAEPQARRDDDAQLVEHEPRRTAPEDHLMPAL